jgi:hypothetical protein
MRAATTFTSSGAPVTVSPRESSKFVKASATHFTALVWSICLVYFGLQVAYILRLPLVMDEFQGAETVIDLTERFPYRDFPTYKTLLGYYLQLPAMLLGGPPWRSLMFVKFEMAIVNTLTLAGGAFALRRFFQPGAVVLGLGLTVLMSNFLERSSELRVDMLTAWPAFASLLLLLGRRWLAAGAFAGISFLISQKGIYFNFAGGLATFVAVFSQGGRFDPRPPIRFAVGAFGVLLAYLLFWTALTSWDAVYYSTFVVPQRMAFQPLYQDIRFPYWVQTIERNPGFYAFALAALGQMAFDRTRSPAPVRDRILLVYGLVLVALSVWHRQPWPYYFVLLVPTLFVLCVSFFDRLSRTPGSKPRLLGMPRIVAAIYLAAGLCAPLLRLPLNLVRDNGFQREMVKLAYCALEPHEGYVAGMDMVYERMQPVGSLRWMDRTRLEFLRQMDPSSLRVLTDSMRSQQVKLWVVNYRTEGLPLALKDYAESEYTPMWGAIRIYGPRVPAGLDQVLLRFSGPYTITTVDGGAATIDGNSLESGSRIVLNAGPHSFQSDHGLRLQLRVPECEANADPRYKEPRDMFPAIYTY